MAIPGGRIPGTSQPRRRLSLSAAIRLGGFMLSQLRFLPCLLPFAVSRAESSTAEGKVRAKFKPGERYTVIRVISSFLYIISFVLSCFRVPKPTVIRGVITRVISLLPFTTFWGLLPLITPLLPSPPQEAMEAYNRWRWHRPSLLSQVAVNRRVQPVSSPPRQAPWSRRRCSPVSCRA